MSLGILRTWQCQNKRCNKTFTHGKMNPACPACGSTRTQWIPGGFNIGNTAKNVDRIVKDLAASFGMTDIPTSGAGEAVKRAQWRKNATTPKTVNINTKDWKAEILAGSMTRTDKGIAVSAPPPVNFKSNSRIKGGGTATLAQADQKILRQHTEVVHRETGRT